MSTNQELSIKGTVSLEDFLKYNSYHSKTFTSIYFLISFIILWALGILFELPLPNDLLVWMIVSIPKAIQALILTILIFFALKKLLKRRATKEYESDQLLKTEINYSFNSEGITQQVRSSNSYFKWSDIHVALEQEEMFLLYLSKQKAMVLPKRFFDSNDNIDLFKNIVSRNIETSKVKFFLRSV